MLSCLNDESPLDKAHKLNPSVLQSRLIDSPDGGLDSRCLRFHSRRSLLAERQYEWISIIIVILGVIGTLNGITGVGLKEIFGNHSKGPPIIKETLRSKDS